MAHKLFGRIYTVISPLKISQKFLRAEIIGISLLYARDDGIDDLLF